MRAASVPVRHAQWAGVLLLGVASLVWADKVAEVGADFLEYLGSMESDEDNWTDFTNEALAARNDAGNNASSAAASSASSSSMAKPATRPAMPDPDAAALRKAEK